MSRPKPSQSEQLSSPVSVTQDAHRAAAAQRKPSGGERPALEHRLYSHRLRVQASAKSFRDRLLSGPMVDVYVGRAGRHWSLHKNLLSYHSDWLKEELEPLPLGDGSPKQKRSPGKETEVQQLDLEDFDPRGFELFVKWMYQGKLDDVDAKADDHEKYEYCVACYHLHTLCSRLDMPLLKNGAMDQYRKGLHTTSLVPDAEEINQIYRASPSDSPFRKLMIQIAARQIMDPDNQKDAENYRQCFEGSPDFAVELVNAIKESSGGLLFDDPTTDSACDYHDHTDGSKCSVKNKRRAGVARSEQKITAAAADSRVDVGNKQAGGAIPPSPDRSVAIKRPKQQRPFRSPSAPPKPPDPVAATPSPPKLAVHASPPPSAATSSKPPPQGIDKQRPSVRTAPRRPKPRLQPPSDDADVQRPSAAGSPLTPPPSPPQLPVTPQRSVSFSTPITQPGSAGSARPGSGPRRTASAGILKSGRGARPQPATPPLSAGRAGAFNSDNSVQQSTGKEGGDERGAKVASRQELQPARSSPPSALLPTPYGAAEQPRSGRYETPPTSVTSSSSAERGGKRAPPKLRSGRGDSTATDTG